MKRWLSGFLLFAGFALSFPAGAQHAAPVAAQIPDAAVRTVPLFQRGDVSALGTTFYNNTLDTNFYLGTGDKIFDDIPFQGVPVVSLIEFAYYAAAGGPISVTLGFNAFNPADGTPGALIAGPFLINNLPPDVATVVTVDLAAAGLAFPWPSSPAVGPVDDGGWISWQFSDSRGGLLTATGGNSQDLFYDAGPEVAPDLYNFGGDPEGSFHIRLESP